MKKTIKVERIFAKQQCSYASVEMIMDTGTRVTIALFDGKTSDTDQRASMKFANEVAKVFGVKAEWRSY